MNLLLISGSLLRALKGASCGQYQLAIWRKALRVFSISKPNVAHKAVIAAVVKINAVFHAKFIGNCLNLRLRPWPVLENSVCTFRALTQTHCVLMVHSGRLLLLRRGGAPQHAPVHVRAKVFAANLAVREMADVEIVTHTVTSASSGQIDFQSVGNNSFLVAMPRSSAITAMRINLSSGMRLFDFHSETEGGFTPARSATANVPPSFSISCNASMPQLLGQTKDQAIGKANLFFLTFVLVFPNVTFFPA